MPSKIAVAVSGGADSMALALKLRETNIEIVGLTVNHNLRKESADETKQVQNWLSEKGIEHHILNWNDKKPTSNIQSIAREARYDLMTNWCLENGIKHLFVAHTLDDQVETFLLRLARGSGVYGLAGMENVAVRNGVKIIRPLLDKTKDELTQYLRSILQEWIEDPSNQNEQFSRIKIRNFIPELERVGVSKERINLAVQNLRRTKDFIEGEVEKAFADCVAKNSDTEYLLNIEKFYALHEEIAYRLLKKIISDIGGKYYPPRFDEMERLYAKIDGRTLGNCKFSRVKNGVVNISKER